MIVPPNFFGGAAFSCVKLFEEVGTWPGFS